MPGEEANPTDVAPEVEEKDAPVAPAEDAPVESDEPVDPYDSENTPDEPIPDVKTKNATEDEDEAGGEEKGDEEDAEDDAEEKPPVISEELLYRAEQAGFTKEEALEFGNPKLLEMALKRAAPAKPAEPPKKEEAVKLDADDELKLLEMKTEEGWDPDVAKQFTAIKDFAQKQMSELKALKAQFGEVSEYVREQVTKATTQRLDSGFEKAAEQYGDIFGKGSMDDIAGINRVNRIKVLSEMNALAEGYRATSQKIPEEKVLMDRAMRNLFAEDSRKKITKEIAGKVVKRNKNLIARPSHKKGSSNLPPEQAAAKEISEKYADVFKSNEMETF